MLLRAVRSVLEQSFADYELLVVDDGSTEDLSEVSKLVTSHGHTFLSITHSGVAAARNRALECSDSKWVALLDSDDFWRPEKLELQMKFHERNEEIKISQCDEVWFRGEKQVNRRGDLAPFQGSVFEKSLRLCGISSSSVMLQRALFDVCGRYDEKLLACEDYDLWLRVTRLYEIGLVPEQLVVKHGGHDDQLSQRYPVMDRFRVYSLIKLLLSDELSDEQLLQLKEVLLKKARILRDGARKRALPEEELYEEIFRAAEKLDPLTLESLNRKLLRSFPAITADS